MRDYYDVLGVSADACADEVTRAHRQLVRRYHPDISGEDRGALLAGWLGDEIAIDFPSASSVLDRIRQTFFGPDAVVQSSDVVVSAEQAFHGAFVRLQVPLRRTCHGCGGRGEIWPDCCRICAGAGEVAVTHEVRLRVPAGVREGARFRFSVMPRGAPSTLVEVRMRIR